MKQKEKEKEGRPAAIDLKISGSLRIENYLTSTKWIDLIDGM